MRSVRATNTDKLEVLSMCIPSKVGGFNQEYYPSFTANESSSTAEAWLSGTDVPVKTMQMSEGKKVAKTKKTGLSRLKTGVKKMGAKETPEETKGGDSAELQAQISKLQAELNAARAGGASGSSDAAEDFNSKPVLGYWAIRGLGAQIRYMLHYLNVNFEDKMY
jgi:hypothetical protein